MIHQLLAVRGRTKKVVSLIDAELLVRSVVDLVGMRLPDMGGNPILYDCIAPDNVGVGVVGLVVAQRAVADTSHIALHTHTSKHHDLTLIQFDLYSSQRFDPGTVCNFLKNELNLFALEHTVIDRTIGLIKEGDNAAQTYSDGYLRDLGRR